MLQASSAITALRIYADHVFRPNTPVQSLGSLLLVETSPQGQLTSGEQPNAGEQPTSGDSFAPTLRSTLHGYVSPKSLSKAEAGPGPNLFAKYRFHVLIFSWTRRKHIDRPIESQSVESMQWKISPQIEMCENAIGCQDLKVADG